MLSFLTLGVEGVGGGTSACSTSLSKKDSSSPLLPSSSSSSSSLLDVSGGFAGGGTGGLVDFAAGSDAFPSNFDTAVNGGGMIGSTAFLGWEELAEKATNMLLNDSLKGIIFKV